MFAMNPFPISLPFLSRFPGDLAGMIVSFQKAAFENTFEAAEMIQERVSQAVESFSRQNPWLPESGKLLMSGWTGALQEEGRSFSRSVREGFERMEESLARKDEELTPDVVLDVPVLNVDEIRLNVDTLQARISLMAELANLVRISVGADAEIGKVDLDITGADAKALLRVRLEQVKAIFSRALETLDRNPDLIGSLLNPVGKSAEKAGKQAGRAPEKSGEIVQGALFSDGSLKGVAKGIAARKGPVQEALREVSRGIDRAIQAESGGKERKQRRSKNREPDLSG